MSRELLNGMPDWALSLMFVAIAIAVTLAMLFVVRRVAPRWRDEESSDKVVGVAAMVMTLFALVLAFVIVNLYNGYESASADVNGEANSLSEFSTDVHNFPAREQKELNFAIARYVKEVRGREFPLLRDGRPDPHAQTYLNTMIETLHHFPPKSPADTAFYQSAATDLDQLATVRNERIDAAEASIPPPLLGLLIFLALLTLLTTVLVRTRDFSLDLVLCLCMAAVVGAGMVTASILEYPYSGTIAVSSSPFERADLNAIVQSNT
jgi:hypothetical protein